jgi:hypothetical protein
MKNNDIPKIGVDFHKWSDLDDRIPKLDLNIELFQRNNVWIASFVILAGLLKGARQQREQFLSILSPFHFDPKSLARYLYTKFALSLQGNETIPISILENWIPQYATEVWGESPPEERMLFSNHLKLRQILSLNPTEEQVYRAIELRKEKMQKYGYESKE